MASVGAPLHPCSRQCSRLQASQAMCWRTNTFSRCTAVSGTAWPSCVLHHLATAWPHKLHTTQRTPFKSRMTGVQIRPPSCFLLFESQRLTMPAG